MWYAGFLTLVGIAAGTLVGAITANPDHPQRSALFAAAYGTAAAAALCLLPPLLKWLGSRRRSGEPQVLVEYDPAFDERTASRNGGTVHLCRVRLSNRSNRLITNGRIMLADLVPAHQGDQTFLLRSNLTLAPNETVMVNVATHVEGVEADAALMNLQLPVFGSFYMAANRGIITGEHQLTIRFERENDRICEKRFRLYVNRINVMHLSEML